MKIEIFETPREFSFTCPKNHTHIQRDYGEIYLEDGDLVSFVTASGKKSDVVGKSFGFFVTQSMNKRLAEQGLRTALIISQWNRHCVVVVDTDKMEDFWEYLEKEGYSFGNWLDEAKPEK